MPIDKSVRAIPPESVSLTQALPLYFKTCPLLADDIVTSVISLIATLVRYDPKSDISDSVIVIVLLEPLIVLFVNV